MKKVFKWTRRVLAVLLVLLVVLGIAVSWLARSVVTRDLLVEEVEEELNARVELGEVKVKLVGMPSRLVLRDLKIGPRDEWVGRPLEERPPLPVAPVQISEVRVGVELLALLQRRIAVKEFVFVEPRLEMTLLESGGNSLEPMFRSPPRKKKKRPSSGIGALNVHEVGVLAELEGVALRKGRAKLTIEKSGLVIGVTDCAMELDKIVLDPEALETMNSARLQLKGRITMDTVNGHRYGSLHLRGPAEARLFDAQTGDFAPDVRADLQLGEGSYLTARIPVVDEAWRQVRKLGNLGLNVTGFPERSNFGRSKSLAASFAGGRLTIDKPLSTWFGDWEMAFLDGSWIQTDQAVHGASGELIASQRMSDVLGGQLAKALEYVPEEIRPAVVGEVEAAWFREGRLVAELVSSGELSDPEVDVLNKYPDLAEIVKEAGEDFAKEKLEDLGESVLQRLLGEDD